MTDFEKKQEEYGIPIGMEGDLEVVLAAVEKDGMALQFASEGLRNDEDVVYAAVESDPYALQYASEELRCDWGVVLAAVQIDGNALQFAADELRNDVRFMLNAFQVHGTALQYAPEEQQSIKWIVLAAVESDGMALQYASEELRNDKEVVLTAVKNARDSLQFVSEALRKDPDIIAAAEEDEPIMEDTPEELPSDMPDDSVRENLTRAWENVSNRLLDLRDLPDDYDDDDNCESDRREKPFSYEECLRLITQTKEYFDHLPVKGCMTKEDFPLYEAANALRYLHQIFAPEKHKEEFADICARVTDLFHSFESFAK